MKLCWLLKVVQYCHGLASKVVGGGEGPELSDGTGAFHKQNRRTRQVRDMILDFKQVRKWVLSIEPGVTKPSVDLFGKPDPFGEGRLLFQAAIKEVSCGEIRS